MGLFQFRATLPSGLEIKGKGLAGDINDFLDSVSGLNLKILEIVELADEEEFDDDLGLELVDPISEARMAALTNASPDVEIWCDLADDDLSEL